MENLYSKRNRRDSYMIVKYDKLPEPFRNQLIHICRQAIGWHHNPVLSGRYGIPVRQHESVHSNDFWADIEATVVEAHGLLELESRAVTRDSFGVCMRYILQVPIDQGLDVIELAFRKIETLQQFSDNDRRRLKISLTPDEAIKRLNQRFKENNLGYRYEAGKIIPIESDLYYQEVTRPAFILLQTPGFEGPLEEFHQAHRHYRAGDHDSAIVEACKAFESTLKAIFDQREIRYDKSRATLRDLLTIFLQSGLVPTYFQDYLINLEKVLQCIGTVRSREGAHGGGSEPADPDDHLVAFSLHQAAANIVFAIGCHKSTKIE